MPQLVPGSLSAGCVQIPLIVSSTLSRSKPGLFSLWMQAYPLTYVSYEWCRHTQLIYFLAWNGKTIGWCCLITWQGSTDCCPLSGLISSGDRTLSLKMPRRSPSRPWLYLIIMYGFIKTKEFYIWSSKKLGNIFFYILPAFYMIL